VASFRMMGRVTKLNSHREELSSASNFFAFVNLTRKSCVAAFLFLLLTDLA
jgi:hypothetical protein